MDPKQLGLGPAPWLKPRSAPDVGLPRKLTPALPAAHRDSEDELAEAILGAAVVAAAGYGLYKLGKWLFSSEDQQVVSADQIVHVDVDEMLAIYVHYTCDGDDPGALYEQDPDTFQADLCAAVEPVLGQHAVYTMDVSPGSVQVRLVARFRSAARVNLTMLRDRVTAALDQRITTLRSPEFRSRSKVVFRTIKISLAGANAVALLAAAFGEPISISFQPIIAALLEATGPL